MSETIKAGSPAKVSTRSRTLGKRLGRPPLKPPVVRRIKERRATGLGMRKIAAEAGCSVGIVPRIVSENATAAGQQPTA